MKFGKKRRKTPEPHIPFISLADIAWQIIIFFFVASTFAMKDSLNLDIPAADNKPRANAPANPPKTITVVATAGQLSVDGKAVPMEQLTAHIAGLLSGKTTDQERAVLMEGKGDLTFQQDVEIMYAIQKAGGVLIMQEEAK
jgi:biopolymer transport protein ExbD